VVIASAERIYNTWGNIFKLGVERFSFPLALLLNMTKYVFVKLIDQNR
jgi:hypothetical protein